ncbi:MAG: tetratricopeptide repeat protein [Pseudonocardiaceae bacterium]
MLGDDHFDVHSTAHNLGRDLRELGEAEAARVLHEEILVRTRRLLGDEHPSILNTAIELVIDLHALG